MSLAKNKRQKRKILYVFNVTWFFLSHRLEVARALQKRGFEVHIAAAQYNDDVDKIVSHGMIFHSIPFARKGKNVLHEIKTIWSLYKLYKKITPDIVEHATIKPILYGSIVTRLIKTHRIVNWMTGLGYVFINESLAGKVLRSLVVLVYKVLLGGRNTSVIFENPDDLNYFVSKKIINRKKSHLIRGAGVDTDKFKPDNNLLDMFTVMLPARMLWDKGVGEYVEAAEYFKADVSTNIRFLLVGRSDEGNPSAVPVDMLQHWNKTGVVEWLGQIDDMVKMYSEVNIVCLPSYREGLPKSLIEAASCGKPIVTFDVPGCREVVNDGVNGILVEPKNTSSLIDAIKTLYLDKVLRKKMGENGRMLALNAFSEELVINKTLQLYNIELLGKT